MRTLLTFLLLYLLFLVQAALPRWCPDLVLLTVVALATTAGDNRSPGDSRLLACGRGAFAGLLLDLLNPGTFGLNLFTYALVGYGTAAIASISYHATWITPPLVLAALLLRMLGGLLTGTGPGYGAPFLIGAVLTVLLALPWQWTVRGLRGRTGPGQLQ
ncbi:MAG: hypothetical protein R6X14_00520 [bacterium]